MPAPVEQKAGAGAAARTPQPSGLWRGSRRCRRKLDRKRQLPRRTRRDRRDRGQFDIMENIDKEPSINRDNAVGENSPGAPRSSAKFPHTMKVDRGRVPQPTDAG